MGETTLDAVVRIFAFFDVELLVEVALGFANGSLKEIDKRLRGAEISRLEGELFRNERVAAIFLNE